MAVPIKRAQVRVKESERLFFLGGGIISEGALQISVALISYGKISCKIDCISAQEG